MGIYPEKSIMEKETCIPLFTAALFTIARTWKQPRRLSIDEWIKKLWHIYTMKYYSAIKGTHLSQSCPRSGAAAERSNPTSKEQLLCGRRRAERSYSTFKVRRGGRERCPSSKVRNSSRALLEKP